MRDNQTEPTFELHEWFDGGDIFCRPKDKKRLAATIDAIVEKDLGVAIIGSNEAVLDHYCRMLTARMRDHDHFELEVFLPVTTDSLLTRFNEMLAEISMEQAAASPSADQPVRILVINDARMINDEQWGLLARLLSDFPGVNVRLVLVINKSGWPAHENLLNTLGRKMHRWVVEAPATEEARELLDAAEENGYLSETEALLIDAGLGAVVSGRRGDFDGENEEGDADLNGLDPDLPNLPELDVDVLLGVDDKDELADSSQTQAGQNRFWLVAMIVSASLALTLLIITWLYPDYLGDTIQNSASEETIASAGSIESIDTLDIIDSQNIKVSGQPLPESAENAAGDKATIYQVESIAIPSDEQLEARRLQKAEQLKLVSVTDKAPVASKAPAADAEPTADTEPAPEEETGPVTPPIEQTERQNTVARIADAAPNNYFVQHIVLSTEAAAKAYSARYPALDQAMVVPVRLSQKDVYAVISGPFASRPAAATFTQNPGMPADYWIRGATQLQGILRR